jgi:hypothetical protein
MSIKDRFPTIKPTLLLDFANTKTLDPRITFARNSIATYYDGKTVAKAEENLWIQSQNAETWANLNVTVTANATTAPDGTATADKLVATAASTIHYSNKAFSKVVSVPYAFSIYVKAAEYSYVRFADGWWGAFGANFDLTASGVVTSSSGCTAAIESLPNGWFRVSAVFSNTRAEVSPSVVGIPTASATENFLGDGTSGIYVWGAQLEQRSSVTAYTPTTTAPITNYIPQLMTAAAGVPRFAHSPVDVEILGSELVTNGDFSGGSTGWSLGTGWSVTGGAAVSAGGNQFQALSQTTVSLVAGKTYLISATVALTSGSLILRVGSGINKATISSSGNWSARVTADGNGISFLSNAAGFEFVGSIDNISVKELICYTTRVGESLGLLIEEQRTNLLTYSEQFDNAIYSTSLASRTANQAVSPDGSVTADLIKAAAVQFGGLVRTSYAYAANTTYTMSVYAKAGTANFIGLRPSGQCVGAGDLFCFFNLATGVATAITPLSGTVNAVGMVPVGNGCYRCFVTYTTPATAPASTTDFAITNASGGTNVLPTGNETVYLWGAQLEVGAFATSYIPTVASQVTRQADAASMTGTNFSSWYRQGEGTLYAESSQATTNANTFALLSSGINIIRLGGGKMDVFVANTAVAQITGTVTGGSIKQAGAYQANDFAASTNSGAVSTDTSGAVPFVDSAAFSSSVGTYANGTIKKIAYYPARLSNANLQALTA